MHIIKIYILTFLASAIVTHADETKYTQEFRSPSGIVALLKSKYGGKTLKESFSNAGVKFDKEDKVIPPTGSGLFVRSSANNLKIVQQVINSSLSSLHTIDDPEKIRAILTKHTWKGLERPVP